MVVSENLAYSTAAMLIMNQISRGFWGYTQLSDRLFPGFKLWASPVVNGEMWGYPCMRQHMWLLWLLLSPCGPCVLNKRNFKAQCSFLHTIFTLVSPVSSFFWDKHCFCCWCMLLEHDGLVSWSGNATMWLRQHWDYPRSDHSLFRYVNENDLAYSVSLSEYCWSYSSCLKL